MPCSKMIRKCILFIALVTQCFSFHFLPSARRKDWSRTLQQAQPNENDVAAEENIACNILLETATVLIIEKPPGIPHHSDEFGPGILQILREQQSCGELDYQGRLYGVHRLDRVTSGILLLAKDAVTARALAAAFRNGQVMKYYVGLSRHKPPGKKQGWVQGGMERGRRKSWLLTRNEGPNFAKTRFFTAGLGQLQEFACTKVDDEIPPPRTLLLFRPYTGRTHQLRVAAKSVGLALTGDPIYRDSYPMDLSSRTYLHATAMYIAKDVIGEEISVWSIPPFGHVWTAPGDRQYLHILQKLVEKHCESQVLIDSFPCSL